MEDEDEENIQIIDLIDNDNPDFDVSKFLYDNDPDFRKICNEEMEVSGRELEDILRQRREHMIRQEQKEYEKCSTKAVGQNKNESPRDKILRAIQTKEQEAIDTFKKKVVSKGNSTNTEENLEENSSDSVQYSSSKGKRKSSAVIYAEMAKENAKELQQDLIEARRTIVTDLWKKQAEF